MQTKKFDLFDSEALLTSYDVYDIGKTPYTSSVKEDGTYRFEKADVLKSAFEGTREAKSDSRKAILELVEKDDSEQLNRVMDALVYFLLTQPEEEREGKEKVESLFEKNNLRLIQLMLDLPNDVVFRFGRRLVSNSPSEQAGDQRSFLQMVQTSGKDPNPLIDFMLGVLGPRNRSETSFEKKEEDCYQKVESYPTTSKLVLKDLDARLLLKNYEKYDVGEEPYLYKKAKNGGVEKQLGTLLDAIQKGTQDETKNEVRRVILESKTANQKQELEKLARSVVGLLFTYEEDKHYKQSVSIQDYKDELRFVRFLMDLPKDIAEKVMNDFYAKAKDGVRGKFMLDSFGGSTSFQEHGGVNQGLIFYVAQNCFNGILENN